MTASRFIQMVKAKKPKVTYFSSKAKCMLMETLEDFEMIFYTGEKLLKSPTDGIKITDSNKDLTKNAIMEHFDQCYSHCVNVEKCLTGLEIEGNTCFPIVIGVKPKNTLEGCWSKLSDNNINFSTTHNVSNQMLLYFKIELY